MWDFVVVRLAGIAAECRANEKDPEALFLQVSRQWHAGYSLQRFFSYLFVVNQQLKEAYGKDPRDDASLIPPLQTPAVDAAGWYFALITECFESIAAEISETSTGAQGLPVDKSDGDDSGGSGGGEHPAESDGDLATVPVSSIALSQVEGEAVEGPMGEDPTEVPAITEAEEVAENAAAAVQAWDSELADGKAGADVHIADDFKYW